MKEMRKNRRDCSSRYKLLYTLIPQHSFCRFQCRNVHLRSCLGMPEPAVSILLWNRPPFSLQVPTAFCLYETTFSTQLFSSFLTSALKFSTSCQQSSGRRSCSR